MTFWNTNMACNEIALWGDILETGVLNLLKKYPDFL